MENRKAGKPNQDTL